MSRVGGASRPVTLRPNTQWFNPDEFEESSYAPQNDVPFGRMGGAGGGGGRGGDGRAGGSGGPAGRGGFVSSLSGAGRGAGAAGRGRGGPIGGRTGPVGGGSRYEMLGSADVHGSHYPLGGGGGGDAEILGRGSMNNLAGGGGGNAADILARSSLGGSISGSADILGRTSGGGGVSSLGGGGVLPLGRTPSFGRVTLPPALKLSSSGEVLDLEPMDRQSAGGGGVLRRVGSGRLAGGPLPGPVGPLGALKGPPPPSQIPDRPGSITTTTTQTDGEGRTIVTKTVVTRTHSGRIRTEVTTTTSGPAHLINGGGGGGGGGALGPLDEPPPMSPGMRLAQGSGLRAARSGGSAQSSPDAVMGRPSGVTSAAAAASPVRGAASSGSGTDGAALQSPRRPSITDSLGGGPVGVPPPPPGRRPSQTGVLMGPLVRPVSGGKSASVSAAAPGQLHAPGTGPSSNLRNTWGGATAIGGGINAAPIAAGSGVAAARMSSPARLPVGVKPAAAAAAAAAAGSGRAPSAGRLRMSPAFAAAHGLGAGAAAGGGGGGGGGTNGVGGSHSGGGGGGDGGGGGGQEEVFLFGSGGGSMGLEQRPSSGRYGNTAAGQLSPPSSPEPDTWNPAAAARLQPLSGGGGLSAAAAAAGMYGATPYHLHDEGATLSHLHDDPTGQHPQALLRSSVASPVPGARPSSAVRSPSTAGLTPMAPPEALPAAARRGPVPSPPAVKPAGTMARPAPPAAAPPPSSPPVGLSPKAAATVAAAAAAAAVGGGSGGGGGDTAPVRTPQPPASPKPPPSRSSDGGDESASRIRQSLGKAVFAAKMMGARRNAGQCAVSLAFLRRFRARLVKERKDAATLSTSQVVQEVIKPMTASSACRLADLNMNDLVSEADIGPPDYFISHAWSMPFLQLLDCFFNHLQGALDSTRVWLDIFAVNQHPGAEQKDDLENLRTAIALSQATLVCLDARGTPLERVWCLYEFDNTLALKGADALVLLTPGFSTREIASIFRSIDVDAAKATVLSDKQMILDDIRAKHGSTEAFNAKLKLRFLLDPLDAKPDMMALAARAGTDAAQWNLRPVAEWLASPQGPQVAVLTAAPGTGKSTITAVLCLGPEAAAEVAAAAAAGSTPDRPATAATSGRRRSSTPGMAGRRISTPSGGAGGVTVHAFHFCKYSDARRQDPVRVVKTLAYQLAQSLPELGRYYCGLDPGTLMQLNQPDTACRELLVMPLQQTTTARGQQILLVLDALDEADKTPQPTTGGNAAVPSAPSAPSALDNKVLQLLLHQLSLLPDNVRILATIRPDPHLLGPIRDRFPNLRELTPGMLRRQDKTHSVMQTRLVERFGEASAKQLLAAGGGGGGGGEASLVYYPVVALLQAPLERVPASLPEAFGAVFAQTWPKDPALATKVKQLLEVLVAAQEPPPMSLLATLGVSPVLESLPGWGVLFYERDHAVHVLHRTLIDWLEDRAAAGPHYADARRGHALMGKHLLTVRPLGVYGARYLVTHLIKAGSEPALLDAALQDLAYLEAACRTGDVFKLHAELASLPDERTTDVVADVVRWLGLNGAVLWNHPQSVTQVAAEAPRCSSVWQVGDRSAKKNAVDMLNEPYFWPLEVMALTQHKAAVPDVTYSPDGRLMVSASLDGSIRLWDAHTGEPKAALAAPPMLCLSYSPGSELMATGGDGGALCLWDPSTGLQRASLTAHKDAVTAIAFGPDGALLASGGRDKVIRLWLTVNCSKVADLKGHTGPLLALAFSPDGAVLASAAHDDAVPRLWHATEGRLQAELGGHRQGVLSLAFSPAGGLLATAADNVRLWDAASGAARGALTDHIFPVAAVAFTPDGTTLVSADTSHTLRLWGMGGAASGGGKAGGRPKGRGPPGGGPGGGPPAGVVPLAVLEAESGGQLSALAVSPDGGFVATASMTGELHVFAVQRAAAAAAAGGAGGVFTVRAAHAGQVRRLAFSPDSHSLVSASDDCTLRLWDPRVALAVDGEGGGGSGSATQLQAGAVTSSVHYSRSSSLAPLLAASLGEDGTLSLWDGSSGDMVSAPQRVTGAPRPVVVRLSPDEETLAVGEPDGSIRLWDLTKGTLKARLKGHTDAITDLDFCGLNPALLASSSEDCRVRLWNTGKGRQLSLLTGHTASVTSVALSVDGAVAASGDESGAIRIWAVGDGGNGRAAAILKGHSGAVFRLAFCPADGGLLASGGADCSVRLWDVGGGKQLAVLSGHKEVISRLVWGTAGRVLASGSRGAGSVGSVYVWDCRTGEAVYSLHAAYMAPEDGGRPGGAGGRGLCTVVSALEHAPHLTLVYEADGGGSGGGGAASLAEVEAGNGLLRLRQVPLYTSFAAPSSVAVAEGSFAMAFGSHVYFYRLHDTRVGAGELT